jgi:branched-chain amino acid transport system substrate-binding protein
VLLKSTLLSGALLALVAAIAGCGSSSSHNTASPTSAASSSPTSAASSTSGSTQQQATGTPIKVGVICSCTGSVGTFVAPYTEVYQAWAKTVNASGGINGHPVQLIVKDDGSSPATSFSDAQTLIADKVVAIGDGSVLEQSWAATVKAANIPVVGYDQSSLDFGTNSDFYSPSGTADTTIPAMIATAKTAGATNLGAFYCAEAPQCSELIPPLRAAAQKAGLGLAIASSVAVAAPNFTAQCVAAQQDHITGLAVFQNNQTVVRVAADCERQNYHPIYLIQGSGFAGSYLTSPGIKDNMWAEMPDVPFTSTIAAVQAMNASVDKYYPGLRQSPSNWTEANLIAWASGMLLEDAVKAGGLGPSTTPSAAEVVTGLDSLKGDTLGGMSPPLTFTANQPHKIDCWFTVHVTNGVANVVNNGQTTCESSSSSS